MSGLQIGDPYCLVRTWCQVSPTHYSAQPRHAGERSLIYTLCRSSADVIDRSPVVNRSRPPVRQTVSSSQSVSVGTPAAHGNPSLNFMNVIYTAACWRRRRLARVDRTAGKTYCTIYNCQMSKWRDNNAGKLRRLRSDWMRVAVLCRHDRLAVIKDTSA